MRVGEHLPAPRLYCRWFVNHGARTYFDTRGFRSKQEASDWIDAFGSALDWRAGFVFRLKGDDTDTRIVNRRGEVAA